MFALSLKFQLNRHWPWCLVKHNEFTFLYKIYILVWLAYFSQIAKVYTWNIQHFGWYTIVVCWFEMMIGIDVMHLLMVILYRHIDVGDNVNAHSTMIFDHLSCIAISTSTTIWNHVCINYSMQSKYFIQPHQ